MNYNVFFSFSMFTNSTSLYAAVFTKRVDSMYAELSLIQNDTEKITIVKDSDYLEPIC